MTRLLWKTPNETRRLLTAVNDSWFVYNVNTEEALQRLMTAADVPTL